MAGRMRLLIVVRPIFVPVEEAERYMEAMVHSRRLWHADEPTKLDLLEQAPNDVAIAVSLVMSSAVGREHLIQPGVAPGRPDSPVESAERVDDSLRTAAQQAPFPLPVTQALSTPRLAKGPAAQQRP